MMDASFNTIVKIMVKQECPFRDKIFACVSIFYQYLIPNGMRRSKGCPVRDKILVENVISATSTCRPVGTKHNGYCVPNGTPVPSGYPFLYQYLIPNGMTKDGGGVCLFYQYIIPNGMHRSEGCPVRDKILVENVISTTSTCRPVGTKHNGYLIPNGMPLDPRMNTPQSQPYYLINDNN